MRTPENVLKIGVLNLMHDKLDTKRRFERILKNSAQPVELTFFYKKRSLPRSASSSSSRTDRTPT